MSRPLTLKKWATLLLYSVLPAYAEAVTGSLIIGFDDWQRTVFYDAPAEPVIDATGRYIFTPGTMISWTDVTWNGTGAAPFERGATWDGVTRNPQRRTGHARDSRNVHYDVSFAATSPYTLQEGDVLDFFQSVSEAQQGSISAATRVGPGDTTLVIHCETSVPTLTANQLLFAPGVVYGPSGQRVSGFELVDFSALYALRPTVNFTTGYQALPSITEFKALIAHEWTMNTLTDLDTSSGGYEAFVPYEFCRYMGNSGYSGNVQDIYLTALFFLVDANTSEADWIHLAKWVFRQGKDAIDAYLSEDRVSFHGRNFYDVGNNGGGHSAHNEMLAVFYAYGKGEVELLADWTREIRINWEQCIRHTVTSARAATQPHTNSNYPEFSHITTITEVIESSSRARIEGEPAIKIEHPYVGNRTDILGMDVILASTGEKLGTTRNRIGGEPVTFLNVSDRSNPSGSQHELAVDSIANFAVGQEVYFRPLYPIHPRGYDFSINGCFIADDDGEIYSPPAMGDNTASTGYHNYSAAASAQYKGNQNDSHATTALYIGAFAPSMVAQSHEVNAIVGSGICGSRPTIQWGPWNAAFNDTWRPSSSRGDLFDQAGAVLLSEIRLGPDQPHWTQPDEWFLGSDTPPSPAVFFSGIGAETLNWTTTQGIGYKYSIYYSTDLLEGFHPLATDLPDTESSTSTLIDAPSVFYYVRAE